jgi:ATP-dependent DNA ligase
MTAAPRIMRLASQDDGWPSNHFDRSGAFMVLKLALPLLPMEARSVDRIPRGDVWQYEPKWDGFRCLVFRDDKHIELQSKSGQPLTRYFPELVEAFARLPGPTFVLDGEIVVPAGDAYDFDALLQRIHPAASRVKKLAAETPARFIAFDLLAAEDGAPLLALPLEERRKRLEAFARPQLERNRSIELSPLTRDPAEAERWLKDGGGRLDGVIAKRRDVEYRPADRSAMQKIKNFRSADCVVGGFRYGEGTKVVGSLLLGLYDGDRLLHHVGFTSNIKATERKALTTKLERLIKPPGFTGKAPGGPSRWSTKRSAEWQPLKPELVVEVCYDHFSGGRFRHGTRLLRWRPDKAPRQCTLDQVERKRAHPFALFREPPFRGAPKARTRRL